MGCRRQRKYSYLVFRNLLAVKGDTTQMHLSTEMIIVIKLEMFIVPILGPRTVLRCFWRQYSPKSLSKRPRKVRISPRT